jgi:Fe-S-cluster containining protein
MKFQMQKRLREDTDSYERDAIEKYVDYLREKGRILEIGNLLFDGPAMMRPFVCDTRLCIPRSKKTGPRRKCTSCCVVYAPRLSTAEKKRIEKILPGVRERFKWLDARIKRLGGYYEWDDSYDRLLTKDSREHCVFLTPNTREFGFHACAIHAYCLENGLSTDLYKPSACVMFPFFLLETNDDEGTILITSHNREVMALGEKDDGGHTAVGCLKRNPYARRRLYIEMKNTLVAMFGQRAWNLLDAALRERNKWQ